MNTSVDYLLSQKEDAIYTVDLDATVEDAVKEMNSHKIGFVMVLSSSKLHLFDSPVFRVVSSLRRLFLAQQCNLFYKGV